MQLPDFGQEELRRSAIVFAVDDEAFILHALTRVLKRAGLQAKTFSSAEGFLAKHDPTQPGCLLLDVSMPGMNGLQLQKLLKKQQSKLPIIILTGNGNIRMAVDAIKDGAIDFIEKPFDNKVLLKSVWHALETDARDRFAVQQRARIMQCLERLTTREREVMGFMMEGKATKAIACLLGISARTCEQHRAKVMKKMEAASLADLIRMSLADF
jgi:two-component system response regulator TtrR